MKTTKYFFLRRKKPDRATIEDEWIERVIHKPEHKEIQADGRIRFWARIVEANEKWLLVVTLEDGITIHNAFFDQRMEKNK